jgi:polyisoprenoid-binding protein YceI
MTQRNIFARAARAPAAVAALAAAALAHAGAPPAAATAPALVPSQSEIGFVSHEMGVPLEGKFRRFDAQVQFDPKAPQKGHFLIDVDVASVSLPTSDAMEEVVKPTWFNAAGFPHAQFASTAIKAIDRNHFEISGRITIKGLSQDLVVPVAITQTGGVTVAAGDVQLHRLAFAIGDGEWKDTSVVADNVEVKFHLALTGIAPL